MGSRNFLFLSVVSSLSLLACGPIEPAAPAVRAQSFLSGADAIELAPAARRAELFEEARERSRAEAEAGLSDGVAIFPVERDGHLVAAALPSAKELMEGDPAAVNVDLSSEPWPAEAREALGGASERQVAARLAAAIAARSGLSGRPAVARDVDVPYAAAVVEGQVRLNPALIYLAAAVERPAAWRDDGSDRAACSSVSGLYPAAAIFGFVAFATRRRRSRS